uniref:Uncharacterized protein n=1 Tax=Globisporangium ultimum (strain ATCC 200006 / CBS 805.95 / DAOM BR144) TaxID=431595 RepID=K3W5U4_GLOUD
MTAPLNLLGFHGKMHFYHVYGFHDGQTYDAVGDNRVACERVDTSEETVFSYLPSGHNASNRSAWLPLYTVALSETATQIFAAHTVELPSVAMHTAAQFRWEQSNHSSFPIDVPNGLTKDEIQEAENDGTGVDGHLGIQEQEVWQYRNLFDQWALDNVRLEVRLNVPLFIRSDVATPGTMEVVVTTSIQDSWVEFAVGDGTHAFPSCNAEAHALYRNDLPVVATAQLTLSGYIHAVACLHVNASLISSFPTRSPRFLVQARAPTITSVLDASTSIDEWRVTMECTGCEFMRYTMLTTTTVISERDTPSCSYGVLVNGTASVLPITSNARLLLVACGHGLIASTITESPDYQVFPRAPSFKYDHPETTVTGMIDVTIVPPDPTSAGVVYTIGHDVAAPACLGRTVAEGETTISVPVWEVIRAVACCVDRVCEDSKVATWGPIHVRAVAPLFSMSCSRVKPLTMIVEAHPVTLGASMQFHVKSSSASSQPLTCQTGGTMYSEPLEIALTSTQVHVVSCLTGLDTSAVVEIDVVVESCCAGLDAYLYPSCAHVLLLEDDFGLSNSECLDPTKWRRVTSQWGGENVNGGVHADNVGCMADHLREGKMVLELAAHGDLFPGTSPIGHRRDGDGSLVARTVDDRFTEWALDGASPFPCNQLDQCSARRVGAAISTMLQMNAGVLILRLKPCEAFGTLTQVWWGDYEENNAATQQEMAFLSLWKAALYQTKTTPGVPFALSSPSSVAEDDDPKQGYMDIGMQWNASDGRANLYVNGLLVHQQKRDDTSSSSLSVGVNSSISIGVWFPNAVAGEPLFQSCAVLVDKVQIFSMEVSGGRWCDLEMLNSAAGDSVIRCAHDTDCEKWVTRNCFMDIYEAVCVTHRDELSNAEHINDDSIDANEDADDIASDPTRFCQFRLQPRTRTSVLSSDMTKRDQTLHWSNKE